MVTQKTNNEATARLVWRKGEVWMNIYEHYAYYDQLDARSPRHMKCRYHIGDGYVSWGSWQFGTQEKDSTCAVSHRTIVLLGSVARLSMLIPDRVEQVLRNGLRFGEHWV